MGIFDKFKKKKIEKKPVVGAIHESPSLEIEKIEKKSVIQKAKTQPASAQGAAAGKPADIYSVLKSLRITEEAGDLAKENKYVFEIQKFANKIEIKKAIQKLYNVEVKKVNIINIPRKKRRLRGIQGWKSGKRKTIVTLSKGKIEIG